jgi:hypothetical protein
VVDTDTVSADGCFADVTVDLLDDGTVEGTGLDVYDAVRTDLLLHVERDVAGVGLYARDFVYDADGFVLRVALDDGFDGTEDYVASYTRDDGRQRADLRARRGRRRRARPGEDLHLDRGGQPVHLRPRTRMGTATPTYATAYTYEGGLRVSGTEDVDGDGVTDVWYTYTYDDVLRLTLAEGDIHDDGKIEYTLTKTVHGSGAARGHHARHLPSRSGPPDLSDAFAYDAEGRLVSLEEDEGADGFVDEIGAWIYDTDGLLVVEDEQTVHAAAGRRLRGLDPPRVHLRTTRVASSSSSPTARSSTTCERVPAVRQTWTFGGICA